MNFKGKWINEKNQSSITFENIPNYIESYEITYIVNNAIRSKGRLDLALNIPPGDGSLIYGMPSAPPGFGGYGSIHVSKDRKLITIKTYSHPDGGNMIIYESFISDSNNG